MLQRQPWKAKQQQHTKKQRCLSSWSSPLVSPLTPHGAPRTGTFILRCSGEPDLHPRRPQRSLSCLTTPMTVTLKRSVKLSPLSWAESVQTPVPDWLRRKGLRLCEVYTNTQSRLWFLKVWCPESDDSLKELNQNYHVLFPSSFPKHSHLQREGFPRGCTQLLALSKLLLAQTPPHRLLELPFVPPGRLASTRPRSCVWRRFRDSGLQMGTNLPNSGLTPKHKY